MSETLDSMSRTLVLKCYTDKIYPCTGYHIESNCVLTNKKITINFIQVITPDFCLLTPGPASTFFNFTALANGVYTIELNLWGSTISGQLTISAGSYKVTIPQQSRIQFIDTMLNRIPDNTIFGTVDYTTSSNATTAQSFIDSLQFYGATPFKLQQGDYGQFQIDSSGQIIPNPGSGYNFTRYYIFNYSGNSAPLKSMVKWYGNNYNGSLYIRLNTSKGETFISW